MISVSTSAIKRGKWWEYLLRFVLGGLVTAVAGVIAQKLGPTLGGLFLAFPAILAASVTLVEKHERERKEQKGLGGKYRGRHAAGADAAGAAMGSVGLIAFAVMVWRELPCHRSWVVIAAATILWGAVCIAVWVAWKMNILRHIRMATVKKEELRGKKS